MSVFGVILVRIFPAFCRIRTEYGVSPYSVQMRQNAGKMRTRITSNANTFYAVTVLKTLNITGNLDGGVGFCKAKLHYSCFLGSFFLIFANASGFKNQCKRCILKLLRTIFEISYEN